MSHRARLISWIVGIVVFGLAVWQVGGALSPYIFAAVLAYLFNPLVDRLERRGVHRGVAAGLLVGIVGLIILGALVAAVPMIVEQAAAFVTALPNILADMRDWLEEQAPRFQDRQMIRDGLARAEEGVQEHGMAVVNQVLLSTLRVVDVVIFMVLAPIAAFFLLLDWNRMILRLDSWLPRDHAPTIRRIAADMDAALGGFIRGQLTVVGIMTVYYSAALTLVGLPYGFVVGVIAGIGTMIPIVGATVGAVLALGIALVTAWGEWVFISLVAAAYFGGQLVEGNILTPKLVGRHIGLHPLWLLLAFSIFATLFGFIGVLIAVPVAAMLGVLVRFALERYLESPLYTGHTPEEP